MRTLVLSSNSKKDMEMIKQIALKFGITVEEKSKEKAKDQDWWHTISDTEKQAIERGLSDIKNDRFTPHETVMAELDTYINSRKK